VAGIGIPELIIVLVILLVIFGPKRLPGLGRSLGSGMREFKDSVTGSSKDDDDDRPALQAGTDPTSTTGATSPAATPVAAPTPPPAETEQSRA
jgi:sec-independent protein translocase protein TatA